MLVLIHESGSPGFNKDKTISQFFMISMVIFSCVLEAEKASKEITILRPILGFL